MAGAKFGQPEIRPKAPIFMNFRCFGSELRAGGCWRSPPIPPGGFLELGAGNSGERSNSEPNTLVFERNFGCRNFGSTLLRLRVGLLCEPQDVHPGNDSAAFAAIAGSLTAARHIAISGRPDSASQSSDFKDHRYHLQCVPCPVFIGGVQPAPHVKLRRWCRSQRFTPTVWHPH